MNKKRPTTATVFGVLNIVLGGLSILGNLCVALAMFGVAALINQPARGNRDLEQLQEMCRMLIEDVPGFIPYMIAEVASGLFYSVLLIVSGVGLLKMRAWGRATAIVSALLLLLTQGAAAAYQVVVLSPAIELWRQQQGNVPGALLSDPVSNSCGTVLALLYGIILLVFMYMPPMSTAFSEPTGDSPREADDDLDYQRRRDEH